MKVAGAEGGGVVSAPEGAPTGAVGLPGTVPASNDESDEPDVASGAESEPELDEEEPQTALFPPGPLATVELRPRRSRLLRGGRRQLCG